MENLDGKLVGAALVLGLACIIASAFSDRHRSLDAVLSGEYFHMTPLRSSRMLALGMWMVIPAIVYAAMQSGYCMGMTPQQNSENRMIGYLLAAVFSLGGGFYLYAQFMTRYAFNQNELVRISPLRGREVFAWKDFSGPGLFWGCRYLSFAGGRRVYYPSGRCGVIQLEALVSARIYPFDTPSIAPFYDAALTKPLIGRKTMVVFYKLTPDVKAETVHSFHGVFESIGADKTVIRSVSGKACVFPANFAGVFFDELEDDGTEEIETFWYLNNSATDIDAIKRDYC